MAKGRVQYSKMKDLIKQLEESGYVGTICPTEQPCEEREWFLLQAVRDYVLRFNQLPKKENPLSAQFKELERLLRSYRGIVRAKIPSSYKIQTKEESQGIAAMYEAERQKENSPKPWIMGNLKED